MSTSRIRTLMTAPLLAIATVACDAGEPSPFEPGAVVGEIDLSAIAGEPVLWFSDFSETGGVSRVTRTPRGVNYQLRTQGLTPGNAYTLWFVVFNDPTGCTALGPGMCGDTDVVNDAARPDLLLAGGRLVGASGSAMFSGRRRVGDGSASANGPVGFPAYGLEDADAAEVHLVVHDHGPMQPAFMPDMISSIDGGCTDAGVPFAGAATPWNDYAGPPGGAYGRRSGNTCGSIQFAVHKP